MSPKLHLYWANNPKPIIPSIPLPDTGYYITFRETNSGFNIHRQSFHIAMTLAYLYNRTLLIPDRLHSQISIVIDLYDVSLVVPVVRENDVPQLQHYLASKDIDYMYLEPSSQIWLVQENTEWEYLPENIATFNRVRKVRMYLNQLNTKRRIIKQQPAW